METRHRPGGRGISPTVAATGLALLLASCSSARVEDVDSIERAARPPSTAPAPSPAAESAQPAEPARWRLDDVLARIASANPTIALAEARLDEARAVRGEADASWLPELSVGVDWTTTDQPSMAFGLLLDQHAIDFGSGFDATPGSTENWRKDVRLEWALFAPGRGAASDAAGEGELSAELAVQAVERRLLNAGIQGWVGLRAARALEEVAREGVAVVERRLAQTRTRHAEGAALRSDVLRLEVSLSAARQDAVRAGQVAREAQSAVNVLMGRAADAPLEGLEDEDYLLGAGLPEDLDALTSLAGDQRAELRAAAHRVRMLTFQSQAAHDQRLPFLHAFARYGWDGEDPGIDTDLDSYAAGLSLRLPLSARTGPRIAQAEARERQARADLREMSLVVAREVRDAQGAVAVARESLALAASSVEAAEEAFRIVAESQDAGAATVTDVLEAENARREARTRRVVAEASVQIALARLVAAVGGVR